MVAPIINAHVSREMTLHVQAQDSCSSPRWLHRPLLLLLWPSRLLLLLQWSMRLQRWLTVRVVALNINTNLLCEIMLLLQDPLLPTRVRCSTKPKHNGCHLCP